jgi:probable rRNA maturation factor
MAALPETMTNATRVDVQQGSNCERIPRCDDIRRWAVAALQATGARGSICIRVVDEAESADLNAAYRNKAAPTNVLSFPADVTDPQSGQPLLGDLAICAPLVAREADQQRISLDAHWAHLVVHGTLHLMGYDHQQEADAARMERREIDILERLGVADPYAVRSE